MKKHNPTVNMAATHVIRIPGIRPNTSPVARVRADSGRRSAGPPHPKQFKDMTALGTACPIRV